MITGLDHIVLAVRDVAQTVAFYHERLGFEAEVDADGKWTLHLGAQKINLQHVENLPSIAKNTLPGTANFCVLTSEDTFGLVHRLREAGISVLKGPVERIGATGQIMSVYFNDPDGNLVEIARPK
ncbi:MAG: VOC family protein [Paracoccaceae bacterium]